MGDAPKDPHRVGGNDMDRACRWDSELKERTYVDDRFLANFYRPQRIGRGAGLHLWPPEGHLLPDSGLNLAYFEPR